MLYRLSHYFEYKGLRLLSCFFYFLNIVIFGCEITPQSQVGGGMVILHVVGNVIHAKIGENVLIYGHNTLGGRGDRNSEAGFLGGPIIGNNVVIGDNTNVYGPITIGNNVRIAAMSMVTESLPDDVVAGGIPAKITPGRKIERNGGNG
jgi:serine O-acetyltransferase